MANEVFTGTDGNDLLEGTNEDDILEAGIGDDTIFGLGGNDSISGGEGNDFISGGDLANLSLGGSDTLTGGEGDDAYFVSLSTGGGTIVRDAAGELDFIGIIAENTDITSLANDSSLDNSASYGDSVISLTTLQRGIIGLEKSDTSLIIDLDRDGVAETEDDLTIVDFFDGQGELGTGAVESINNIIDTQEILALFNGSDAALESSQSDAIYRFFNQDTGVHFYTASETERDAIRTELSNFAYEGIAYNSVDSLTGEEVVPVYRFFNRDTGVHFYTVSPTERDAVEQLDNFSFEGEAFSAYSTEVAGSVPIYRFFNPTTGGHFYTPSAAERDAVEQLDDFSFEGIAYYALPASEEATSL